MHIVRFDDAPKYEARNHRNVTARRIQGREAGGAEGVYVSISEYPPGSGGDSIAGVAEVVYVVLKGTLRITSDDQAVDLSAGDSVSFAAGENRSAHNDTEQHARLLVIHQS